MLVWSSSSFNIFLAEEAERIIQCKGRVFCLHDEPGVHRVWLPDDETPGLAMSRAFGDYCVKDYGLISVPEVTQRDITSRDQFVVLATDGVLIFFSCSQPHWRNNVNANAYGLLTLRKGSIIEVQANSIVKLHVVNIMAFTNILLSEEALLF